MGRGERSGEHFQGRVPRMRSTRPDLATAVFASGARHAGAALGKPIPLVASISFKPFQSKRSA
jgi:hypothetical protein